MKRQIAALLVLLLLILVACNEAAAPDPAASPLPDVDGRYATFIPGATFHAVDAPKSFGGKWTLEIRDGEYTIEGAFRITENLEVNAAETLTVTDVPAPAGAFNCFDEDGIRLLPPDEVQATYSYALEGEGLELVAEEEPCPYRQVLLERTWKLKG